MKCDFILRDGEYDISWDLTTKDRAQIQIDTEFFWGGNLVMNLES